MDDTHMRVPDEGNPSGGCKEGQSGTPESGQSDTWGYAACIPALNLWLPRFGLPGEIISDNGKQFRDNPFKDWCEKLCIRQCFASKEVDRELSHVRWVSTVQCIKSSKRGNTILVNIRTKQSSGREIGMAKLRTAEVDQSGKKRSFGNHLDLIEEEGASTTGSKKAKKKMEKYYNSRVRGTSFKPGEMVYRSNEASHAKDGGKLGPKWEGPYEVKESLGNGAYRLKDRKENDMPRTWNICNLKKCYIHEM
ncbi:reverse transcriptase domain-containing protein [Tanacetum coccineum]